MLHLNQLDVQPHNELPTPQAFCREHQKHPNNSHCSERHHKICNGKVSNSFIHQLSQYELKLNEEPTKLNWRNLFEKGRAENLLLCPDETFMDPKVSKASRRAFPGAEQHWAPCSLPSEGNKHQIRHHHIWQNEAKIIILRGKKNTIAKNRSLCLTDLKCWALSFLFISFFSLRCQAWLLHHHESCVCFSSKIWPKSFLFSSDWHVLVMWKSLAVYFLSCCTLHSSDLKLDVFQPKPHTSGFFILSVFSDSPPSTLLLFYFSTPFLTVISKL